MTRRDRPKPYAPCRSCGHTFAEHVNGACLYQSSKFAPAEFRMKNEAFSLYVSISVVDRDVMLLRRGVWRCCFDPSRPSNRRIKETRVALTRGNGRVAARERAKFGSTVHEMIDAKTKPVL